MPKWTAFFSDAFPDVSIEKNMFSTLLCEAALDDHLEGWFRIGAVLGALDFRNSSLWNIWLLVAVFVLDLYNGCIGQYTSSVRVESRKAVISVGTDNGICGGEHILTC